MFLMALLPSLVAAQIPHTFDNGEVADADHINENFESLRQLLAEKLLLGDRFEIDCTADAQALFDALKGGHTRITVLAGTCDLTAEGVGLAGRELSILGVTNNDAKPVLDMGASRFNSTASQIALTNLVMRGGIRSAVGFLLLQDVDIDCSSMANPSEHGIWVYGSQFFFTGSTLSGCGGMQVGFNGSVYAADSQINVADGALGGINTFQGGYVWSERTAWQSPNGLLMNVGSGTGVSMFFTSEATVSGDITLNFGGQLMVSESGPGFCPEPEPEPQWTGTITMGFSSLLNWPARCQSSYPVTCKDGLVLTGYSEGLTCR
jgi:hypothetical protein